MALKKKKCKTKDVIPEATAVDGGDNTDSDTATPDEISPGDWDDDKFDSYIFSIRDGGKPDYSVSDDSGEPEPDVSDSDVTDKVNETEKSDDVDDVSSDSESDNDDEAPTPWRSYASEDDFMKDVQTHLDTYKKQRDGEEAEKYKHWDRISKILPDIFSGSDDLFDALATDLEDFRDRRRAEAEEKEAEESGISVEELRDRKSKDADAQSWRDMQNARKEAESARDKVISEWTSDAVKLKKLYPEFNLEEALKIVAFSDALRDGGDIFDAYNKIRNTSPDEPVEPESPDDEEDDADVPEPEKAPKRPSLMQNASSSSIKHGSSRINPAQLSDKEWKKYLSDIRNV